MRTLFRKLFPAVLLCASALAADGESSFVRPKKVADGGFPLPRETSYQQKGIGVGLGLGALFPSGSHCNTLAQWQGTLEYYYARFISAGFSVRMYGGNIDNRYSMIYQRYHTHFRLHFVVDSNWSFYASPTFGFESTSLSEIRETDASPPNRFGVTEEEKHRAVGCDDEYGLDGFSGGMEFGTGYRFARDWALNGGFGLEYNVANVGQLSVALGLGFNLRNHWRYLRENFLGGWIVLEFLAHNYFSEGSGAWGEAVLLAFILNI